MVEIKETTKKFKQPWEAADWVIGRRERPRTIFYGQVQRNLIELIEDDVTEVLAPREGIGGGSARSYTRLGCSTRLFSQEMCWRCWMHYEYLECTTDFNGEGCKPWYGDGNDSV